MIEGNTPKNGLHTDKIMFEVYQMKYQFIDWDIIPDVINKDQFYQICHISKSTALHLLKSGKVPCEWTGKKHDATRLKKRMSKNIYKPVLSILNCILLQAGGMEITMWQNSQKSYLKKCSAVCTPII